MEAMSRFLRRTSSTDSSKKIDAKPVPIQTHSIVRRISEHARPSWSSKPLQHMLPENGYDKNPLMIQFYTWDIRGTSETSWWKHFEQNIPNLSELGVTHVWLPPPTKGQNLGCCGYTGYDLWDIGEFNQKGTVATRWGTKEEFIQAIAVAKKHGIEVLIDAVLGHKLGAERKETFEAIPVEATNRLRPKGPRRTIEAWTLFEFPGRGETHSKLKLNHEHFTGVDYDSKTKSKDIYYIPAPHRKGWSKYVSDELGNYDYLLGCDVDHNHPEVREDLLRWGPWILETTGAGGFRLDAIKHFDRRFLLEFLERTNKSLGKNVFAVAEVWSDDFKVVEMYLRSLEEKSTVFDVPLHYNFHRASKALAKDGTDVDLRNVFKHSLVDRHPMGAVTFVDNHDTQIGQTLESWVYKIFKRQAYAMILFRGHGLPCVFYGDLYQCPDPECYDPDTAQALKQLLRARKLYAYGPTTEYFSYRNCIGFVRAGSGELGRPGCAVVIRSGSSVDRDFESPGKRNETLSSRHSTSIRMKVEKVSKTYRDVLRSKDNPTVLVSVDGWGVFPCPAGGVAVWVAEEDIVQAN